MKHKQSLYFLLEMVCLRGIHVISVSGHGFKGHGLTEILFFCSILGIEVIASQI